MIFCAMGLRHGVTSPLRLLALFFAAPVLAAVLSRQLPGVIVVAADAIFGVGLVCLVFLYAVRAQRSLSSAFIAGVIAILAYGIVRYFLFGDYLSLANDQSIAELNRLLPQMYNRPELKSTIAVLRYIWPASWIVPQLAALFLGLILFMRLSGAPFVWSRLNFPKYYNFLILAVLPVYLVPQFRLIFVNVLISLCVIPFIQGMGVLIHLLGRIIASKVVMVILILILLTNSILIVLLGFADLWLDFRKINTGGNPA